MPERGHEVRRERSRDHVHGRPELQRRVVEQLGDTLPPLVGRRTAPARRREEQRQEAAEELLVGGIVAAAHAGHGHPAPVLLPGRPSGVTPPRSCRRTGAGARGARRRPAPTFPPCHAPPRPTTSSSARTPPTPAASTWPCAAPPTPACAPCRSSPP